MASFLRVLDGPWSTLIVEELLHGPRRFGQLHEILVGISPTTLSSRLRSLEAMGVVERSILVDVAPSVEYRLTDAGVALRDVLDAMAAWATQRLPPKVTRQQRRRTTRPRPR